MCNTSRIQVKVMFMRHITVWCCPLPGSDYRFLMDSHRERCCTWPKYDAAKIASACNNMMKFDTLLPKVNIGGVVLVTFWKWSIKEVLEISVLFSFWSTWYLRIYKVVVLMQVGHKAALQWWWQLLFRRLPHSVWLSVIVQSLLMHFWFTVIYFLAV